MSRQVTKKNTFQIRLDIGWWKILSQLRTDSGESFKSLVEYALAEVYTGISESELDEVFKGMRNAQ